MADQGRPKGSNRGVHPRDWMLFLVQLIPLALSMLLVAACAGTGGLDGFGTSRRTDLMLSFFANGNGNGNSPLSSVNPILQNVNENENAFALCAFTFPEIQARLVIRNGIGATIEQVVVNITETNGEGLLDLSGAVPISRTGEFDFVLNTNISLPASPITSTGASGPGEPIESAVETTFFIPIQLYETNVFCRFMVFQPTLRPLLARVTFRGTDVLGNGFTVVGFMLMSNLVEAESTGN